MLLDQLLLAPVMTLLFFTSMRVLEDATRALMLLSVPPPPLMTAPGETVAYFSPGLVLRRAFSAAMLRFGPTMKANYMVSRGWKLPCKSDLDHVWAVPFSQ